MSFYNYEVVAVSGTSTGILYFLLLLGYHVHVQVIVCIIFS
jgi:hypothetical protein